MQSLLVRPDVYVSWVNRSGGGVEMEVNGEGGEEIGDEIGNNLY
jgi:hypothetical protein